MHPKLKHYLQRWKLSAPELIATTATSHIYRARLSSVQSGNSQVILKLLTRIGEVDERNGPVALRAFKGQGAIRVLHYDNHAHLLEYVEGENLVPLVERGQDRQATHIIAEAINQMHNAGKQVPDNDLTLLSQWCRSLFNRAKRDTHSEKVSLYQLGAQVARRLLDNPQEECVLHGDIHHGNILHSSQRGWLAIDPKGLYGERTYDLANTLCNPNTLPELVHDEKRLLDTAGLLAEATKIEYQRVIDFTFMYACLSASWSEEDQQNASLALGVAERLLPHITRVS